MMWITHRSRVVDDLMYLDICKKEVPIYERTRQRVLDLKSLAKGNWIPDEYEEEWREVLIDSRQSGLVIVVFASMSLEALINRYGAENTSNTYFKHYLDKLDVPTKWLIIPKLVTGQAISTDSQEFEQLCRLFRYRNRVVHYKAVSIDDTATGKERINELSAEFHEEVKNSVRALFNIPTALKRLDPDFFDGYDFYDLNSEINEDYREYV